MGHYTACSDSVADAKDAFARNVARMTQQLLRYREHDWRPVQYRDALAATAPARLEEPEAEEPKPRSRMLVRRPGSLSAEERNVGASAPDPPAMSGAELLQELLKECTLGKQQLCGAGGPAPRRSSSSRLPEEAPSERHASKKQLELQTELNESRRALEKMAHMLHDREEQLRLAEKRSPPAAVQAQTTQAVQAVQAAAAGSPPPKMSPRMAAKESIEQIEQCVRERAKCEVLRAELAERDVEIQRLRASERATEQRAAEELRCARLELAETRRQQES